MIKSSKDGEKFFEMTVQLNKLYQEFAVLSSKKPDGVVGPFKLKIVNRWLGAASGLMPQQYHPVSGFTEFDASDVPSYSDVLVVITQYIGAIDRFSKDHTENRSGDNFHPEMYWVIPGEREAVPYKSCKWKRDV